MMPTKRMMWRWHHPGIECMLFWAAVCLRAGFFSWRLYMSETSNWLGHGTCKYLRT
jgi:hypothetical protein